METQEPKPTRYFYPRSPCGERPTASRRKTTDMRFLSTLSLRRATTYGTRIVSRYTNFYPRSPCGERPWQVGCTGNPTTYFYPRSPCGERHGPVSFFNSFPKISIHALLAESDPSARVLRKAAKEFLSTLSLRRATTDSNNQKTDSEHFYPRSPCGERQ